jgi:hypothetical protein
MALDLRERGHCSRAEGPAVVHACGGPARVVPLLNRAVVSISRILLYQ